MPKLTPAQMKAAVEEFKKRFTPGYYHGSPSNKIKAFDSSKAKDPDLATPGVTFVTRDPDFAESFLPGTSRNVYKSGATMYPVSVNLGKHWDPNTEEGMAAIKNYLQTTTRENPSEGLLKRGDWTEIEHPDFLDYLRKQKYDTFHVMEGGVPNVGIFDPKNIRGKFAKYNPEDAESPDFMKAKGGPVGYAPGGKVGALAQLGKALARHPHGQDPKVAQALEEYLKGNISQEERLRILNQQLPIRKWSELPPAYTDEQIINALMTNKQSKALAPIPAGMRVGNRLDIPAYTQKGVYVDTTHDPSGKAISYGRTGHLKDIEFTSKPNQAVRVGLGTKEQALTPMGAEIGSAKSPFALIKGTNVGTSDDEVRRMMAEMLNDPNYTQIGMDPRRHSQFYDKSTGLPVFRAEEKLQSGPLILAPRKDLEITDWNDPRLELTDFPGKKYAPGGKVVSGLEALTKTFFKPVKAGDTVSGMVVRKDIPNTSSIGASLYDYSTHGVQEVPMSAFTVTGKPKYRSVEEENYTKDLARQIQANKELNPLIVVKDDQGYYVLEGAHRFDALRELGTESFPAYMVHDLELLNK